VIVWFLLDGTLIVQCGEKLQGVLMIFLSILDFIKKCRLPAEVGAAFRSSFSSGNTWLGLIQEKVPGAFFFVQKFLARGFQGGFDSCRF